MKGREGGGGGGGGGCNKVLCDRMVYQLQAKVWTRPPPTTINRAGGGGTWTSAMCMIGQGFTMCTAPPCRSTRQYYGRNVVVLPPLFPSIALANALQLKFINLSFFQVSSMFESSSSYFIKELTWPTNFRWKGQIINSQTSIGDFFFAKDVSVALLCMFWLLKLSERTHLWIMQHWENCIVSVQNANRILRMFQIMCFL